MNTTFLYNLTRLSIVFVWFYHGLVPKLLHIDTTEHAMNMALVGNTHLANIISYVAGVAEIAFALVVLVFWYARWPLWLSQVGIVGLSVFVLVLQPALALQAFNPVSTNVMLIVLNTVALGLLPHVKNKWL